MPTCCDCQKDLPRQSFSKWQFKKPSSERRCRACSSTRDEPAASATPRPLASAATAAAPSPLSFDSNIHTDDMGRTFCAAHKRDFCMECCMDFRMMNEIAETNAGLRKKKTPVEEAAEDYAIAMRSLRGMEQMRPRPTEEVFEQNRQYLREAEEKLRRFAASGEDVETAKRHAVKKQANEEIELQATMQAMARLNPGQTQFEAGGAEHQRVYDEFIKGPNTKATRADHYSCSYCGKTNTAKKLLACSRCKKESYCSVECQHTAWKAHKKLCVPSDKEAKSLPLTWKQVEAHQGVPVTGKTLEIKAIMDESMMRQVFQCKDRVGDLHRVAAYTNSRKIPGLRVGSTLKWKNPRFHYFMDGSSGARIEEEDLKDVIVS